MEVSRVHHKLMVVETVRLLFIGTRYSLACAEMYRSSVVKREELGAMLRLLLNTKGKNFDVVSLMEQAKKAIYNAFGASNLLAGDSGGGSYNLIEGQNSIHSHFIRRDIAVIEEAWNRDIWKQTFRLNGFNLDWRDIPVFKAGEMEPVSLDEMGSFINRTLRATPAIPEVVNNILRLQGVDARISPDATATEIREMMFTFEEESKVGTGEGSSGTGSSQEGGAGSKTNTENKS